MVHRRPLNPEGLVVYQHDASGTFRFVLLGQLKQPWVDELRHAWTTASSVIQNKELVIDLSALTAADNSGIDLLSRMRESGARIIAPASQTLSGPFTGLGMSAAPRGVFRARGAWCVLAAWLLPGCVVAWMNARRA
ncbi:MAG TPA: hypothetical protein VN442_19500 [Bryobacteraceae bacterium]|nr:hypothetical protein [Bryobacteraceae bacterium]